MQQGDKCFIGLDIGGTTNKIVVLSTEKVQIQSNVHLQVTYQNKKYHLLAHSHFNFTIFEEYLIRLKKQITSKIQIVGTGGGSTLHAKTLAQIFETPVKPMSQFEAHAKGLEIYSEMQLPITLQTYQKNKQEITLHETKSTLQKKPILLFVSLGSGVNFQLYGKGDQGYERQKAKDVKMSLGDGFFLEGTCLGAGYLMGLGRMLTGQKQYSTILSKMKQQDDLKQYFPMVMVNLFQMALNQSLLHQKQLIYMSGTILSIERDIKPFVIKSFELYQGETLPARSFVRFDVLEGYLGSLGALYSATR